MEVSLSKRSRLSVHIVEDHDEALPVIYRAIGRKTLPFESIAMIHFDAHPDLLCPDIKVEQLANTDELYRSTSIADWILPAVYMGHIDRLVWVTSPWSTQIPPGEHALIVGRDKHSGHIRVATSLTYFVSEMLYVSESQLEHVREIPLLVVVATPSDTTEHAPTSKRPRLNNDIASLVGQSKVWILDIDLDFFSTGNPYRGPFTETQYDLLRVLYQTPSVADDQCNSAEVVRQRTAQLEVLNTLWAQDYPTSSIDQLGLTTTQIELLNGVRSHLGHTSGDQPIDQEFVHTCGVLTELPLHISTDQEVRSLMNTVSQLLEDIIACVGPPSLVTVARSTEDEYTPARQVDTIQEQLLLTLSGVCRGCRVKHDYLNTYCDKLYEPPGKTCDCSYL